MQIGPPTIGAGVRSGKRATARQLGRLGRQIGRHIVREAAAVAKVAAPQHERRADVRRRLPLLLPILRTV